eukprot:c9453_g1_i1.p1 GENE.c9453_g1_i1~~c9453_g1_i1.p1  ORF type:complete len:264 (+),score=52.86 c9453_g1_i1:118-909(+)
MPESSKNTTSRHQMSVTRMPKNNISDNMPVTANHAFWWRKLKDEDPISLQPLRRLTKEPFNLPLDDSKACWFDCGVLCDYLASTCNFTHPINRRAITLQDCQRLDAHATHHRISCSAVTPIFLHKDEVIEQRRLDATRIDSVSIASSLFSSPSRASASVAAAAAPHSPPPPPSPPTPPPTPIEVIDNEEHFPTLNLSPSSSLTSPVVWRSVPHLSTESFPSLPSKPHNRTLTQQHSHSHSHQWGPLQRTSRNLMAVGFRCQRL